MVQKVTLRCELEAGLCHTQMKIGTFFQLEKDKAAKGEGRVPPFISCAQDSFN